MLKPRDHNFLDAFLTNAEGVIDSMTDNEAVKSVPVIGTAFKICKGIDDIRSRSLMAKLAKFIGDPSLQPEATRKKIQEKLRNDPDGQTKIGESLFLVIEKVTDLEKPALLAQAFSAYLDGVITSSTMLRLSHAIDLAYIEDLFALLEKDADAPTSLNTQWRERLIGAGFVNPNAGVIGHVDYDLTPLAYEFRKAIAHVEAAL